MLKKLLTAFVFVFYIATCLGQSNTENTPIDAEHYQRPFTKDRPIKSFFIIQATVNKFFRDVDVGFGASASYGIKYLNKFGFAVNAQLYGLDYGDIDFVPVSMEFSYTAEKHKIRPFANMQIGHTFSNSGYSSLIADQKIVSKTKGTTFFSPGLGILIPVKKQSGILLTLSYVRTGYLSNTTITNPAATTLVLSRQEFDGYRFGIGFKF